MKNITQNTERETYELKLKELLDNCIFFKADDNREHTPREYYEKSFTQLIDVPFMYFLAISETTDSYDADKELKEFIKEGGGAKAAYELVSLEIHTNLGFTLDFKNIDDTSTDGLKSDFHITLNEFNTELESVVSANPIKLHAENGKLIDFVTLTEPRGLYGADEADGYELVKIDSILQSTATGKVYAMCEEYDGLRGIDFDVVGTKEEIYQFIIQAREKNILDVANLQVSSKVARDVDESGETE